VTALIAFEFTFRVAGLGPVIAAFFVAKSGQNAGCPRFRFLDMESPKPNQNAAHQQQPGQPLQAVLPMGEVCSPHGGFLRLASASGQSNNTE